MISDIFLALLCVAVVVGEVEGEEGDDVGEAGAVPAVRVHVAHSQADQHVGGERGLGVVAVQVGVLGADQLLRLDRN